MARGDMPLIDDDRGLDRILGRLLRTLAATRTRKHQDTAELAPLEAEITARSANLAERRAVAAEAVAGLDQKSRILLSAVVRYVTANWDRLKTTPARIVRASGIRISRTAGKWSIYAVDEDAAVAELQALGLGHLIRMRPVLNRTALQDCSRPTEDGKGVIITVGTGTDAREVTISSIQQLQGPETWKVEMPGSVTFEATAEELAQLLAG